MTSGVTAPAGGARDIAVMVVNAGPDGTLALIERDIPVPGDGELLVAVAAVGVNNADLMLRRGFFGAQPCIPGIDVAGTVVAAGRGVDDALLGRRVVLNPAVTCGHCAYCIAGDHGTCVDRQALGQKRDGGYAGHVVIPGTNAFLLHEDASFEEAAALPSNFFTAWQMLMVRARVQPGETVLVTGAAGGVGSAAIQIARLAGARVIGAVGSSWKKGMVEGWGVDDVIDCASQDLAAAVLEMTDGHGVEVIIDVVGASLWPAYMTAIARGGRLVVCGVNGGARPDVDILTLMGRQISLIGAGGSGSRDIARRVVALFNAGRLKPHVQEILPLSRAMDAHRMMETRSIAGKIILTPP